MTVVDLREVIKRTGLLGIGEHVFAAVVLDGDVSLFDIDIGRAVFSHGAEFDQVAVGLEFAQGKEQIQRAHDVVHLGADGVVAIDHRIRRGALFGKVNNGFRLKSLNGRSQKLVVRHIADEQLDRLAGKLVPDFQAVSERANGSQ
jgi:hypothetical protein